MDQNKVGRFIAKCRKEKGLTQSVLAERIGVSDRAVSKWETGKNMPDSGIMLELCSILDVNVNELLTGERMNTMENYKEKAEENLMTLNREKELHAKRLYREENGGGVCYIDLSYRYKYKRQFDMSCRFCHILIQLQYCYPLLQGLHYQVRLL